MAIIKEIPEGAQSFDLEGARAARAEARAKTGASTPFIKLSAGYVEVKPELSVTAADKLNREDIRGGLADILADPADVDALLAEGLSVQDLQAISKFITGRSLGE